VTGEVRVLYEWARTVEGNDILEQVPCYCPYEALGHRNTRDCYWKDSRSSEEHGVDCGECLDIADIATDTPMPEGCETELLLFGGIK
jgi:hypothetical protein